MHHKILSIPNNYVACCVYPFHTKLVYCHHRGYCRRVSHINSFQGRIALYSLNEQSNIIPPARFQPGDSIAAIALDMSHEYQLFPTFPSKSKAMISEVSTTAASIGSFLL